MKPVHDPPGPLKSPGPASSSAHPPMPDHPERALPPCPIPVHDGDPPSNLSGPSAPSDAVRPDGACASLAAKGKARAPPTLPPLSFSPTGIACPTDDWSPTPGPSSYRSTPTSIHTASFSHSPPSPTASSLAHADDPPVLTKTPSRARSLSNLSIQSTTPSMSKIRIKLAASSKAPVILARRLLSRNKADVAAPSVTGPANDPPDTLGNDLSIESGNCLFPWQAKDITRASSPRTGAEPHDPLIVVPDVATIWCSDSGRLDEHAAPRAKGRSYSSPLPKSAFDVVPDLALEEHLMPPPLHARDLFDDMLPRELRLRVFSALISLHEADHEKLKNSDKWSVLAASSSKNRWVGRDRAMRELVKLSRVSKSWRTLVFDGQLWQSVDLRAFPATSAGFLASLVQLSGPFIKSIDLSGHAYLSPTALIDMAGGLCVRLAPAYNFTYTQLTAITLQGCTSLTTQSLHSLLVRSPFLSNLNVKGLRAVTNVTFDVLALCSHLTSLNMSQCPNIDGEGVRAFAAVVMMRGARLALKELRLCGLRMVHDDVLAILGKAAPHLEVLDLSHCSTLHNSALEAFVSSTQDKNDFGETVLLTPREAGRDPRDWRRYRRRVTALRHIALSNCSTLTDTACSNLAYAVPRLEFLELAGIGQTLQDNGLVHLLGTTPFIRKLDLEGACDITDAVLDVITPEPTVETEDSPKGPGLPQPGHALEHLTVSSAGKLSNDAFQALIHGCPKLRVLEADNTAISGAVLKEFVQKVRERGINDAGLVVVDCHSVGERSVKDVAADTRPRMGWRSWEARKLGYLDGRDGEDLKVGQDECDETRVVIKSFYSWQTVDAVRRVRERRKKTNKKARSASGPTSEPEEGGRLWKTKWWPGIRISSGNNTPSDGDDRDGCVVM